MKKNVMAVILGAASLGGVAVAQDGLVVGMDIPQEPIYLRVNGNWQALTVVIPTAGLAADNVNCVLWIASGNRLMRLVPGQLFPTIVANFTYQAQIIAFQGLAHDGTRLLGIRTMGTEGIYEINTSNGVATLVTTTPTQFNFNGFDADPTNGSLFAINNTQAGGAPIGVYSLNPGGGAPTFIASTPGFMGSESGGDVDGLAVAPGHLYLVPDQPGDLADWDVQASGFGLPIPNPWTRVATQSAAAWAPCFLPAPPCNPDYNDDGGADTADVIDLSDDIATGMQSFPNSPDFNNDGSADTGDVIDLADSVASGNCPL